MTIQTHEGYYDGPPGTSTDSASSSTAVLDAMHLGDIHGGMGTIKIDDHRPRRGLRAKLTALLAILGPGLIVMVGDNDAGAFGTYTQAGQNYGTTLVWTLLLLVPVLYINQEMVVRLGLVTGVGHARLILERFGKFWGAFSVIDLFVLNALTIVTEFIGITLAVGYLGLPKVPSVLLAAVLVVAAASTGSFRRFERLCLILIGLSLLLIPVFVLTHPPLGTLSHDLITPAFPKGAKLADVMLLIIGIVGTTVAPWQLFFQQSYVVDKRLTPRFMRYEKVDLWIGIVIVVVGGAAMFGFSAAAFHGHPEAGHFTDARGVAEGLGRYVSHTAGVLFAIALLDASIIGAAAVGLSTSYAVSDVLGVKHSLHRKPSDAKGFYAIYTALMVLAATIVLIPGSPLGLLTTGVQTLAGVLLPSATVFLLLLCNDKQVLGPWTNSRHLNVLTAAIIWILVLLSIILTAAVLFPSITGTVIVQILGFGALLGTVIGLGLLLQTHRRSSTPTSAQPPAPIGSHDKLNWRMPALPLLERPVMTTQRKTGLTVLRSYLLLATSLVIIKIVQVATGG
jgi:NRAMP (natural resistance-associated macrophage protein)-like metal ion transporter